MSRVYRNLVGLIVLVELVAAGAGAQTASPARPATEFSGDPCGSPLVESQLWHSIDGKIVRVEDGGTVLITSTKDHRRVRVHLVGIAVDHNGVLADEAKIRVSELALNKSVEVLVNTHWLYQKKKPAEVAGVLHLKDDAGTDVGLSLVAAGLARTKEPRPNTMSGYTFCKYRQAESRAKSVKLGIWQ